MSSWIFLLDRGKQGGGLKFSKFLPCPGFDWETSEKGKSGYKCEETYHLHEKPPIKLPKI